MFCSQFLTNIFFNHESFTYDQIRLQPEFHCPRPSGSALKVWKLLRQQEDSGMTPWPSKPLSCSLITPYEEPHRFCSRKTSFRLYICSPEGSSSTIHQPPAPETIGSTLKSVLFLFLSGQKPWKPVLDLLICQRFDSCKLRISLSSRWVFSWSSGLPLASTECSLHILIYFLQEHSHPEL